MKHVPWSWTCEELLYTKNHGIAWNFVAVLDNPRNFRLFPIEYEIHGNRKKLGILFRRNVVNTMI
jgi:hypothetical protein